MAFLEILEDKIDGGVRQYLVDTFKAQASALLKLQGEDGLWHTVLTDADSYGEVSGTAAIAAGLLKGIKMGLLSGRYKSCVERALQAICNNVSEDGTVLKFRPEPAWAWTPNITKKSFGRRWRMASRSCCWR